MQGYFESTGSQISLISVSGDTTVHWFVTGSDPSETCFKPFAFSAGGGVGGLGEPGDSTAGLWLAHKKKRVGARGELMELEARLLERVGEAGGKATPEIFLEALQLERAVLDRHS